MENILMLIAVVYVLHLIVGSQLIKTFFNPPKQQLPHEPPTPSPNRSNNPERLQ